MSSQRKVLYLVPSSGLGGAETFIQHVATYHQKEDPVFCCLRPGPLVDWLREKGHDVRLFSYEFRLRSPVSWLRFLSWVRRIASEVKPELVHSTMAYAALLGAAASRTLGLPHVWFQHGPVRGWQTKWASRLRHQKVIVNSKYTFEEQEKFSTDTTKIEELTLGVADDYLENVDEIINEAVQIRREILQKIEGQKDRTLICILARLQEGKGVQLALEAFRKSSSLQESCALVVWGETPDRQNSFQASLLEGAKGLPVVFAGPTAKPRQSMMAADVVLCPSIWPETFGLVIVEGMALGKVVVAPNQGGPRDLFKDSVSGLHFESGDVNSLVEKLEQAANQEGDSTKLGNGARQRVAENYLASRSVARLEEIHSAVLAEKK